MSFGLYTLGFLIMVMGLAIGAHLLNVPGRWIAVGCTVFLGLGLLKAVEATRRRDP